MNGRLGGDFGKGDFTCYSGSCPSLIDYILCSLSLWPQAMDLRVLELVGSDHLPVSLQLRGCIRRSERVKEWSTREVRIRKPVWIVKEKEELVKKKLESEEFQNDCHSILNFSEPAEMDQAVSVIIDRIYESIRPLVQDRRRTAKKDEGFFDEECRQKREEVIRSFRLLKATDPSDQELNFCRLSEYRKVRSNYNRVKRLKKRERQKEINEEIKRAYSVKNPREFWSVVKCSIQGLGIRGDVPPVETWPDYFEKRESEHVRTNDLNGSNDSELGRVNYPLRQNDYDLLGLYLQKKFGIS